MDNPLFSQLSDRIIQQDGYFNPAFIRPIVGKVLSFISQPTTYQCKLSIDLIKTVDKVLSCRLFFLIDRDDIKAIPLETILSQLL